MQKYRFTFQGLTDSRSLSYPEPSPKRFSITPHAITPPPPWGNTFFNNDWHFCPFYPITPSSRGGGWEWGKMGGWRSGVNGVFYLCINIIYWLSYTFFLKLSPQKGWVKTGQLGLFFTKENFPALFLHCFGYRGKVGKRVFKEIQSETLPMNPFI